MIIISGVQGVGKTTLINLLLKARPILGLSKSWTTRPKRENETGEEYEFVTLEEFNLQKENGYFIESVQVHNHHYGTPKKYFTTNMVFNVTASSIENFQTLIGTTYYVSIFISANLNNIKKRIEQRLDKDCINQKMRFAEQELLYQKHFHHIIDNNGDIENTFQNLLTIVDKYLSGSI